MQRKGEIALVEVSMLNLYYWEICSFLQFDLGILFFERLKVMPFGFSLKGVANEWLSCYVYMKKQQEYKLQIIFFLWNNKIQKQKEDKLSSSFFLTAMAFLLPQYFGFIGQLRFPIYFCNLFYSNQFLQLISYSLSSFSYFLSFIFLQHRELIMIVYKDKQILVPYMEDQISIPAAITFEGVKIPQNSSTEKKQQQSGMRKAQSQKKFVPKLTYKQEILKIPKVKQILNKDKYVYTQDIEKRIELIGSLKNENYEIQEMSQLNNLRKAAQKKKKRHKTNFKIPLTRDNMHSLNNLIINHINQNQRFKNEEVIFLKQYTENAPYDLSKLKFMDKLDQVKTKFSEKYPDLNEKVLSKNKLTLENVILNRNIRRQIKLDKKKSEKIHSIKVFSSINQTDFKRENKNAKTSLNHNHFSAH